MKQRKSPVALITVGVVALVGLFIASKPFAEVNLSPEEQAQLAQKREMEKQQAENAAHPKEQKPDTASESAALAKSIPSLPKKKTMSNTEESENSGAPSILIPEDNVYVPKPNDSATSSQWYDQPK